MIRGMKRRASIPDLIGLLCILGLTICLWVRTRWQQFPDPLTYALALASALVLTWRLRKLMERMDRQDGQEPEETPVDQSRDKIDDAQ